MRLYHFLSKEYAFEALKNKRIKVSIIDKLNDPFEFCPRCLYPNGERSFSIFKENISKKYGILCFSKIWSNPLLWSHYAKKHEGFALGFDLPDNAAHKVKYRKKRLLYPWDGLPPEKKDTRFFHKLIKIKFLPWKYENEVRFYYFLTDCVCDREQEKENYFVNFDNNLILKEVIAGCKFKPIDDDKKLLSSLVGGFENIKVKEARMDADRYQIVPH